RRRVRDPRVRPRVHPAAVLRGEGAVPLGGVVGGGARPGAHRPPGAGAVPRRRAPGPLDPPGARAGGAPGAAGPHLLAGAGGARPVRVRAERPGAARGARGASRDRARPSRHGLGGVAVPRDRGDARRLRRRGRLADPERAPEHRLGGGVGGVPSRRRGGDRVLAARGAGERRRRDGGGGAATRAGAHQRSGDRDRAARGRRLSRGDCRGPAPRDPPADARGERLSILLAGARQVVTCRGPARARRGSELAELEEVRGVLFPGFVDCHTHAVFGAPRLDDHERRALGEDYRSIAARGGGIWESVRDVRARSDAELVALAAARIGALLAHGSTTIEVKSGYGLDPATELKQLRAIRTVAAAARATLVPTFLGAHEVPPDYRDRR